MIGVKPQPHTTEGGSAVVIDERGAWAQPGKMAVMLLAPMVQNVSETDRTPHMNAFLIGISFPRFQSNRTRNFSEASTTKKPANIRGSTCCIPDPVGLNPRCAILPWTTTGAEQRLAGMA
jgi:hypothetical protein